MFCSVSIYTWHETSMQKSSKYLNCCKTCIVYIYFESILSIKLNLFLDKKRSCLVDVDWLFLIFVSRLAHVMQVLRHLGDELELEVDPTMFYEWQKFTIDTTFWHGYEMQNIDYVRKPREKNSSSTKYWFSILLVFMHVGWFYLAIEFVI